MGIITERDILKKVVARNIKPDQKNVENIMNYPLVFIDGKTRIEKAIKMMVSLNIRRLPIIEEGKIQGIVTQNDLLRAFPNLYDIVKKMQLIRDSEAITRENKASFNSIDVSCNSQNSLF